DIAEIERTAVYQFRSRVARRWRSGRVLIAGDAAHLTPPFMGQGMCAGIRDVANLGWKLASCLARGHDDILLSSYEAERRPHVTEFIEMAVKLGELICSENPKQALESFGSANVSDSAMKSLSPALGESSLTEAMGHSQPLIGTLFGQPALRNGRKTDDIFPYQAILYSSVPLKESLFHVVSERESLQIGKMLESLKSDSVLIRPDRYILKLCYQRGETLELAMDQNIRNWFV
ncbi:MAG: 3-(3-hydroxyphenyl)propionate hydroxylase, partial [Rhodobacteraceae bacterium]|nr:3-(3-hydroxyphenyl)propionate hydroxylase [Paracoccaceae bacterium]